MAIEFIKYPEMKTLFKLIPSDVKGKKWDVTSGEILPETAAIHFIPLEELVFTEKIDGCLHYNNGILTDKGLITVGKIVEEKLPVKVLSYNINNEILEYKDIEYYHKEKRIRPFVSVGVKSRGKGNRIKYIVCTDNHKFYSEGKWIQAKDLKIGQLVSHLTDRLSYEIKQVILGSLLGDASIYRPSNTTRGFGLIHSINQSEYFEFEKMLLSKIFNEVKGAQGGFEGSQPNRRGNSIVNASISELIIKYCEIDNKKQITEQWVNELSALGVAIWYMDDGSCNFNQNQRPRVRFATNGFSIDEVNLLKHMFKNKYNIDSEIFDYTGYVLCLTADGSEKLFSIISPYVCNSMKYKLPEKYRNYKCILEESLDINPSLIDTEIVSISNALPQKCRRQQEFQYDLTIKDNSNYFTNSILVHNTNMGIKIVDGCVIAIQKKNGLCDREDKSDGFYFELGDSIAEKIEVLHINTIVSSNDEGAVSYPLANIIVYGELCGVKVQKGENYFPERHFIVFDIFDTVNNKFFTWDALRYFCELLELEIVSEITYDKPNLNVENVRDFITNQMSVYNSSYGAEGIVVRHRKDTVPVRRWMAKIRKKDFSIK